MEAAACQLGNDPLTSPSADAAKGLGRFMNHFIKDTATPLRQKNKVNLFTSATSPFFQKYKAMQAKIMTITIESPNPVINLKNEKRPELYSLSSADSTP